jgi:hypothetical protein
MVVVKAAAGIGLSTTRPKVLRKARVVQVLGSYDGAKIIWTWRLKSQTTQAH